jgi:acetolactate decarboxylase
MATNPGEVYQVSLMTALLDGIYDGVLDYEGVKEHGDFGIGTFDHLDGEMIGFDGSFYRLRGGEAMPMVAEDRTPFCTVTTFQPQVQHTIKEKMDKQAFEKFLTDLLPSGNLFYAIRIEGLFSQVNTRTVSYQKTYVPMTEAVNAQQQIQFEQVKGNIIGFWTPAYAQGIAVSGYHFHFIDETLQRGGHVFDYTVENVRISIDQKSNMNLFTPPIKPFLKADLVRKDLVNEIKIAEG